MNELLSESQQKLAVEPGRRSVNIQSASRSSRMHTQCDVEGALCLRRVRSGGGESMLVRLFQLTEPVRFAATFDAKDIVAYGVGAPLLRILQGDAEFRSAAGILLAKGYRLSLGEGRLELTMAGKVPKDQRDTLSDSLSVAASRLEALTGGAANSEASLGRIRRPWLVASTLAAVVYFFSHLASYSPVLPLSLLPAIVSGAALLSAVAFLIQRSTLKEHALAGAVALDVVMWGVFSSVFFSSAICILLNDYAGARVVPVLSLAVDGTVHIAHGKHTSCALVLDASTPVVLDDKRIRTLPMPCSLAYRHNDSFENRYDVQINPGLLGAPFVQSISVHE
ncbi:hypothetical protein AB4Y45_16845 [Paraburkholderia sp. EG287A]|uniref:hypothetical protein n=1 Tax=unclassified Paraburkholderia TaxID=2615204 RepID=UPI0034D22206